MKRILSALALFYGSAFLSLTAHAQTLSFSEISPGIFVHYGKQEETTIYNHGDIANLSFIIGSRGIAVIDTGGSPTLGEDMRMFIQSISSLPILYVINTHVHQDHIMGNVAFDHLGATFVGSVTLKAAMEARGRFYLGNLARDVGELDAAHADIIEPTLEVEGSRDIDLGGRILTLKSWPTAHTDDDLTVWDQKSQILWAGDLLFVDRIPSLDGNLVGWIGVLDELGSIPAKLVVPGHGPLVHQWPQGLNDERRYLTTLRDDVRRLIAQHSTIEKATEQAGLSERDKWLLFDRYHRRNVTAAFAELEWE